ncbi:MAG: PIG-L family deacetylase [Armatimonadota bacterium]|nr:PIG-L family deacetylase [Armatimonadota bacterium]
MRVLAIGAHPDDMELLCAGTLAKYAKLGHKVTMCTVAAGDKGHFHIGPTELVEIRRKEAEKSASLINADYIPLFIPDGEVYVDHETMMMVVDVIRQAKPDVIITHSPTDYMPDHVAASKLAYAATFHATLPHFKTAHETHDVVPPVYYMDTLVGLDFQPAEYVDITDVFETKRNMLKRHDSQLTWLREHDNYDALDAMETCAKFRGLQCGVKYAEGFRQTERWLRMRPERILP